MSTDSDSLTAARCKCDDPLVARYGPDGVCWRCWDIAHGGDGTSVEPESDEERAALEALESEPMPADLRGYMAPYGVTAGLRVELTPAREIRSERVRWLWRDRVPLRSLTVVAGEKGLGKSLLTNARLPAEATRGRLPGELEGQAIDVLVCTGEDDWRSVVKPRLMAHGADLDRVHRITVVDKEGQSTLLTLPDHVPLLEAEIGRLRDNGRTVGMIVVDPIGAFLSAGTDTHRDASVRRALAPLAELAETLDLVVLVVAHLTKDESSRMINRVSGAGAFVNAARSLLVLARSPDDLEGEQGRERVLVHVGSNWGRYAPTLAARVEAREVDLDDGSRTSVGYLLITGECDIGVEDLQRGADQNGGTDVEEAILAALVDGPRPSRDVKAQVATELGCAKKTVERAGVRLSEQREVVIGSGGFPRTTTWALAGGDSAVGTSTNLRGVPTEKSPAPIEDSVPGEDSGDSGDSPRARDATARCCCADGGYEPTEDGRCSRCWGSVETPTAPPSPPARVSAVVSEETR